MGIRQDQGEILGGAPDGIGRRRWCVEGRNRDVGRHGVDPTIAIVGFDGEGIRSREAGVGDVRPDPGRRIERGRAVGGWRGDGQGEGLAFRVFREQHTTQGATLIDRKLRAVDGGAQIVPAATDPIGSVERTVHGNRHRGSIQRCHRFCIKRPIGDQIGFAACRRRCHHVLDGCLIQGGIPYTHLIQRTVEGELKIGAGDTGRISHAQKQRMSIIVDKGGGDGSCRGARQLPIDIKGHLGPIVDPHDVCPGTNRDAGCAVQKGPGGAIAGGELPLARHCVGV